jgi:ribosome-binding protein aMBF1 (putative translation factor)
MNSKAIRFLEEHKAETPSSFVENAIWRKENDEWLQWSRHIALKIVDYMQENGLSRADLAKKLDVSPQYVSKILSGKVTLFISPEIISRKTAVFLGINTAEDIVFNEKISVDEI